MWEKGLRDTFELFNMLPLFLKQEERCDISSCYLSLLTPVELALK